MNGFVILPFLVMLIFYIVILAIGFFVLYLVVRTAINNSKLSEHVEQLRLEISRLNQQLQSIQVSSKKMEEKDE